MSGLLGRLRARPVVALCALAACAQTLAYYAYLRGDPGNYNGAGQSGDQVYYFRLSQDILHGTWVGASHYMPGYPAFLALCQLVIPDAALAAAVVQGLLFAGLVLLAAQFAERTWGGTAGGWAAALVGLNPALGFYAAQMLTEFPTALVLFGLTTTVVRWSRTRATSDLVLAGLLLAAAAYLRSEYLGYAVVLAGVVAWLGGRAAATAGIARAGQALPLVVRSSTSSPCAHHERDQTWAHHEPRESEAILAGTSRPAGPALASQPEGPFVVSFSNHNGPARTRLSPSLGAVQAAGVVLATGALAMAPWVARYWVVTGHPALYNQGAFNNLTLMGTWYRVFDEQTWTELQQVETAPGPREAAIEAAQSIGPRPELSVRYMSQARGPYERPILETLTLAYENIRLNTGQYLVNHFLVAPVLIWSGHNPVRQADLLTLPTAVRWSQWAGQLALVVLAAWQALRGLRGTSDQRAVSLVWLSLAAFLTAIHVLIAVDARFMAPLLPLVDLLAGGRVAALASWRAVRAAPSVARVAARG